MLLLKIDSADFHAIFFKEQIRIKGFYVFATFNKMENIHFMFQKTLPKNMKINIFFRELMSKAA